MLDDLGVKVEGGELAEEEVIPQRTSNTHTINIIVFEITDCNAVGQGKDESMADGY